VVWRRLADQTPSTGLTAEDLDGVATLLDGKSGGIGELAIVWRGFAADIHRRRQLVVNQCGHGAVFTIFFHRNELAAIPIWVV
jgi:hypothetical protein